MIIFYIVSVRSPCIHPVSVKFIFFACKKVFTNEQPRCRSYVNKLLERFSFECRKVLGFAFATLHDWLKKFAPIFHPIRSKTETNRDSLARVFPRFASATNNYFEFWLVLCIVCVLCDWLELLLWFWFYDTQLKTTLLVFLHVRRSSQRSNHCADVMWINCYYRDRDRYRYSSFESWSKLGYNFS